MSQPSKPKPGKEYVIKDAKTYFDHNTLLGPIFGLTKAKATRFKTEQECRQEMMDWPFLAIGIIEAVPARKRIPKLGQLVEIDAKDRILLEIISKEGPIFMKGAHNEKRAYDLTAKRLLKRENGVYSIKSGGKIIEWRNKYTITEAGRITLTLASLPEAVKQLKPSKKKRGPCGHGIDRTASELGLSVPNTRKAIASYCKTTLKRESRVKAN